MALSDSFLLLQSQLVHRGLVGFDERRRQQISDIHAKLFFAEMDQVHNLMVDENRVVSALFGTFDGRLFPRVVDIEYVGVVDIVDEL
eukprot:CAMPEP_0197030812 /NCGR_PEP_ID=MMETSP1384-20130603/9966_1 /TAXON_ID=29189 /ORGANISM="Ammonia sp." /LENGTH=86 /DNA_ID=CAMNT_0042460235 /DNA_START=149 /DNA_END=405 /DNA_ORIENTATION=+